MKLSAMSLAPAVLQLVSGSAIPTRGQNSSLACEKPDITFSMTHIITAASVFHINDVNIMTDPFFSPMNSSWPSFNESQPLTVLDNPALQPDQIPVIDAVLLSHESHPDNLDEIGRQHFIDGRRVFTTPVGANALAPRPGVIGVQNWQTVETNINGEKWQVTGTPCNHTVETQTMGFAIRGPQFGYTDGLPNVIWYSGDTIYIDELKQLKEMFHVLAAVFNMGEAHLYYDNQDVQITMNGKEVARMFGDVGADILVPIHYSPWSHYKEQNIAQIQADFDGAGIGDKVKWLTPGQKTRVF